MKRTLITIIAMVLSFAAMAQSPSCELQHRMQKSFPVQGKVGIEQFYLALLHGVSDCYDNITSLSQIDEGTLEIDKKNGYIKWFYEGCGSERHQCCYWKRNDGSLLVAFYYDEHDLRPDDSVIETSFIQFYTYNKVTKSLDPAGILWDVEVKGDGHLIVQLPRHGKDIKYRFGKEQDENDYHVLKWNGYDFRSK